jgi:hypothetical protein
MLEQEIPGTFTDAGISSRSTLAKGSIVSPQQSYQEEMEKIREKIAQLPDGQDRVVMHQLWQLSLTSSTPGPQNFPALKTHGFIVEQLLNDQIIWQTYTSHLKDFARIGIHSSLAYGYSLQPPQVFHSNLQEKLGMLPAE